MTEIEETVGPYAHAADTYLTQGWLPLPVLGKSTVPKGFTGHEGRDVTRTDAYDWMSYRGDENVGLRLNGVIGIDVDAYRKDGVLKRGDVTISLAEAKWGPLPATWSSTSRGSSGPSRIRFYRIPNPRQEFAAKLALPDPETGELFSDIEIIQRHHRFAVVWPSIHPDTRATYQWYGPDGEPSDTPPAVTDLPWMPRRWLDGLETQPKTAADRDPVDVPPQRAPETDWHPKVAHDYQRATQGLHGAQGSRHDHTLVSVGRLTRHEEQGLPGATSAIERLRNDFTNTVQRDGSHDTAAHEYDRMVISSRHQAATTMSNDDFLRQMVAHLPTITEPPKDQPVEATPEQVDSLKARLLTFGDVLAIEPPKPLIGEWLDYGMLAELPGPYGSLKSFAAMGMCLSVATGTPWLGEPVHQTGNALYCSLEGAYTLGPRYAGWAHQHQQTEFARMLTWGDKLNILDETTLAEFGGLLADLQPLIVVIDTLSKATPGAEENSSEFGSHVYQAMSHFRDSCDASIVIVHHTGHGTSGRGRGFSGLEQDIDVVLSFTGQWKDGPVKMKSEKQKARENPNPKWVGLEVNDAGPVLVPTTDEDDSEASDLGEVKALVLARVTEFPGELLRSDLENRDSRGFVNSSRGSVRMAVDLLRSEQRIRYVRRKLDGDRQTRDYLDLDTGIDF